MTQKNICHFVSGPLYGLALTCASTSLIAQDAGGEADIDMGASYSSLRGPLAFVGFNADNLLGSGLDAQLSYQAGESGEAIDGRFRKTFEIGNTALGLSTYVETTLSGYRADWDQQDFTAEQVAAEVRVGAQAVNGLRYSAHLFWQQDSLDDLSRDISPLITTLDDSTAVGLGVNLEYSTFTGHGPLETGFNVGASYAIATPAGDREWAAAEINGQYNAPLSSGMILALKGEAGQISGRNGTDVNVIDRAFLGNPTPRGFSFGGLGPRDRTDTINTALGGNTYVTSSVEVRIPTPNPDLTVAAFADAAALWDLDQTAGGASGTIDDSYNLRTSVGISVYWDTSLGLLQLNVAKPIDEMDFDQTERVNLNLNFRF